MAAACGANPSTLPVSEHNMQVLGLAPYESKQKDKVDF
jgi:hypothetical protein